MYLQHLFSLHVLSNDFSKHFVCTPLPFNIASSTAKPCKKSNYNNYIMLIMFPFSQRHTCWGSNWHSRYSNTKNHRECALLEVRCHQNICKSKPSELEIQCEESKER